MLNYAPQDKPRTMDAGSFYLKYHKVSLHYAIQNIRIQAFSSHLRKLTGR